MKNSTPPSEDNNYLVEHANLMQRSFEELLGYPLINTGIDDNDSAEQLFYAPFVLLSHDATSDPVFNYANAQGLELFELSWEELITLPSRLSAEPLEQAERDKLLARVSERGFIEDYRGVRISKTGKRFKIDNAIVWNLTDEDGVYQGQAACFSDWTFL
jgi:hypothetical protein